MEKQIYDKLDEIIKYIRILAKDDFKADTPIDPLDFNDFQEILDQNDMNINHLLFDYYFKNYCN